MNVVSNVSLFQVDKIADLSAQQSWQGLRVVDDLPGRGRGVKASKLFVQSEVVCDYRGDLLSHKDGQQKYLSTAEESMGFMFQFSHHGTKFWMDATEERLGPGRLINHSKCHANVSTALDNLLLTCINIDNLKVK